MPCNEAIHRRVARAGPGVVDRVVEVPGVRPDVLPLLLTAPAVVVALYRSPENVLETMRRHIQRDLAGADDLTVDPVNHRAYQTLHSIHHAEHTGSPEEAALEDPVEGGDTEPAHHFMGRWVAAVNVDPRSRKFQRVTYIDLSNGYGALEYPNAEDVPADERLTSFVHAHWVAADPRRGTVLVTGEHTGNLGVVEAQRHDFELEQVVPISISIPACEPAIDETGEAEAAEPHVHGVQVNRRTGAVYVSDEGEDCYYESVTILEP